MGPSTIMLLAIPMFAVLAFMFGRHANRGVRTGAVYAKSTRYVRKKEPIFFWLAVAFSSLFAAARVVAVGVAIWALITLT